MAATGLPSCSRRIRPQCADRSDIIIRFQGWYQGMDRKASSYSAKQENGDSTAVLTQMSNAATQWLWIAFGRSALFVDQVQPIAERNARRRIESSHLQPKSHERSVSFDMGMGVREQLRKRNMAALRRFCVNASRQYAASRARVKCSDGDRFRASHHRTAPLTGFGSETRPCIGCCYRPNQWQAEDGRRKAEGDLIPHNSSIVTQNGTRTRKSCG